MNKVRLYQKSVTEQIRTLGNAICNVMALLLTCLPPFPLFTTCRIVPHRPFMRPFLFLTGYVILDTILLPNKLL